MSRFLTPGVVFATVMGSIWGGGAIAQIALINAGLGYEHGWVFVAIMGFGALGHFAMLPLAICQTPPAPSEKP